MVTLSEPPSIVRARVSASPDASERTRARALREVPRFYSPYLHLLGTTGVGIVTLVVAAVSMHRVRPVELLVVPFALLVSNWFEWRAHKGVLHRRRWPFAVLYDRHTPVHHVIYRYDTMAIRSARELRLVLIPAAGVAAVVLTAAPLAYGVGRLLTPNCGWLMLATSAAYIVTYELSHLSYHLPESSFIGRLALVRVLREHHRRHHHPGLMQRWNFNVTLPLFDWIHRTAAPDDLVRRAVEASRREESPRG
jgi:hypothetical protein